MPITLSASSSASVPSLAFFADLRQGRQLPAPHGARGARRPPRRLRARRRVRRGRGAAGAEGVQGPGQQCATQVQYSVRAVDG